MDVKSVTNNLYTHNNIENNQKRDNKKATDKTDKLEISDKAKEMNKLNKNDASIEEYRQKIANKFYDSDELVKKISTEILKEIGK